MTVVAWTGLIASILLMAALVIADYLWDDGLPAYRARKGGILGALSVIAVACLVFIIFFPKNEVVYEPLPWTNTSVPKEKPKAKMKQEAKNPSPKKDSTLVKTGKAKNLSSLKPVGQYYWFYRMGKSKFYATRLEQVKGQKSKTWRVRLQLPASYPISEKGYGARPSEKKKEHHKPVHARRETSRKTSRRANRKISQCKSVKRVTVAPVERQVAQPVIRPCTTVAKNQQDFSQMSDPMAVTHDAMTLLPQPALSTVPIVSAQMETVESVKDGGLKPVVPESRISAIPDNVTESPTPNRVSRIEVVPDDAPSTVDSGTIAPFTQNNGQGSAIENVD